MKRPLVAVELTGAEYQRALAEEQRCVILDGFIGYEPLDSVVLLDVEGFDAGANAMITEVTRCILRDVSTPIMRNATGTSSLVDAVKQLSERIASVDSVVTVVTWVLR